MLSWATLNTFAIPIFFFVVRNGYSYYRSFRSSAPRRKPAVRPTPPGVARALNVLFVVAVVALISTYIVPPNIFQETNTRIQSSTDVIFNRLALKRDLTPLDEALKPKLTSREGRLLYFTYGPHIIADCSFCSSSENKSYLFFAIPSILAPHIFHAMILGLVTSPFFSGQEGARWRRYATMAGCGLACAELIYTSVYDKGANAASTQTSEIDFFHWRMRIYRGVAIAAVDALLGWVLWLSSTNRFFVRPPTQGERLDAVGNASELATARLLTAGSIRNAVVRDEALRETLSRYWDEEKRIYEEREVLATLRNVLAKTDMAQLEGMADQRVDDMTALLQGPPVPPIARA